MRGAKIYSVEVVNNSNDMGNTKQYIVCTNLEEAVEIVQKKISTIKADLEIKSVVLVDKVANIVEVKS